METSDEDAGGSLEASMRACITLILFVFSTPWWTILEVF